MKAAFITTSTDNCDPVVRGWESFNDVPIAWIRYNEAASAPDDAHLLPFLKEAAPDIIFYIGAAWLPGNPRVETLQAARQMAPTVHICFDGGDGPWWPKMDEYRKAGCFSRQVNIDGAVCPTADLTTLCPIDPRPYAAGREIAKTRRAGFAGFVGNTYRGSIVNPMVMQGLLELRHRKAGYKNHSDYAEFAKWLCETRCTVNTAITGTVMRRHVKGRIIEAGLAGVCVLEDSASPTKNWFTPMHDYIPWHSVDDVAFWLRTMQDSEMERIGRNLRETVNEKYSAKAIYQSMTKDLPR